jgi:CRISPR-associated protein Csd1
MILQALVRYYEILANDPDCDIAPPMYSKVGVSYAINLSPDGDILDIFPLEQSVKRGNKSIDVPLRMIVPEQIKRSGQKPPPNFMCDNSGYVLGISDKDERDSSYSEKRMGMFREFHLKMLAGAAGPEARAVVKFLQKYDPAQGRDHPAIARHIPLILKGKNIVFKLDGSAGYIHEVAAILKIWERYKAANTNPILGQCLVSGEILPIARLHPSIKGVKDANPTGGTLVGFNDRAYESYNRTNAQGLNSPTSEKSAFAYTTALNMGDTTVVYWAESPDKTYESIFLSLLDPDYAELADKGENQVTGRTAAEQRLMEIAQKIKSGAALDSDNLLAGLDKDTRFYVLGLAANAARISVRFFHADPFKKVIAHIQAHYADMSMVQEYHQERRISLYRILQETVSKKSSDKNPSPLMGGAVMRAILGGTPYPAALYYAVIND